MFEICPGSPEIYDHNRSNTSFPRQRSHSSTVSPSLEYRLAVSRARSVLRANCKFAFEIWSIFTSQWLVTAISILRLSNYLWRYRNLLSPIIAICIGCNYPIDEIGRRCPADKVGTIRPKSAFAVIIWSCLFPQRATYYYHSIYMLLDLVNCQCFLCEGQCTSSL